MDMVRTMLDVLEELAMVAVGKPSVLIKNKHFLTFKSEILTALNKFNCKLQFVVE